MSGYRAEATAAVVAGTARRAARIEGGDVEGIAVNLDYIRAWQEVSHKVRAILTIYVEAEETPPSQDVNVLLVEVERRRRLNESTSALSATIRHVRAVYRLGLEMGGGQSKPPRWLIVNAGAAHRGSCAGCGRWVQDGKVWRDLNSRVIYHQECMETA